MFNKNKNYVLPNVQNYGIMNNVNTANNNNNQDIF